MPLVFSNIIHLNGAFVNIKRSDMSESPDAMIQVVYESSIFKPLQEVELHE